MTFSLVAICYLIFSQIEGYRQSNPDPGSQNVSIQLPLESDTIQISPYIPDLFLSVVLKSKKSGKEIVFATTHLKARNGALMPTLRNEQGKDLMDYLTVQARGRPIVCSGDFNAEPNEPVYQTLTSCPHLR